MSWQVAVSIFFLGLPFLFFWMLIHYSKEDGGIMGIILRNIALIMILSCILMGFASLKSFTDLETPSNETAEINTLLTTGFQIFLWLEIFLIPLMIINTIINALSIMRNNRLRQEEDVAEGRL